MYTVYTTIPNSKNLSISCIPIYLNYVVMHTGIVISKTYSQV